MVYSTYYTRGVSLSWMLTITHNFRIRRKGAFLLPKIYCTRQDYTNSTPFSPLYPFYPFYPLYPLYINLAVQLGLYQCWRTKRKFSVDSMLFSSTPWAAVDSNLLPVLQCSCNLHVTLHITAHTLHITAHTLHITAHTLHITAHNTALWTVCSTEIVLLVQCQMYLLNSSEVAL